MGIMARPHSPERVDLVRRVQARLLLTRTTRADFARQAGIDPSTLQRGLKRKGWSDDNVRRIEAALGAMISDGARAEAVPPQRANDIGKIDELIYSLETMLRALRALKAKTPVVNAHLGKDGDEP
ncbi:hypothetical protein [Azospirillum brasilense]|uniref:hypothetical protein n=1 Tax=Azospirillum brasilense TaxID=192 RepID=UPI0011A3F9C9|nr:hypothetical protein [Azospirillum brasilense]